MCGWEKMKPLGKLRDEALKTYRRKMLLSQNFKRTLFCGNWHKKLAEEWCFGLVINFWGGLMRDSDNMKRKKESSWGMSSPGLCFTNTSDMLPQIFKGMSHSQALSWPFIKYFCALILPFLQCSLREDREHGFLWKSWQDKYGVGRKMCPGDFECATPVRYVQTFQSHSRLSVTSGSTGDENSPTMGLCLTTFIPYFPL